MSDEIRSSEKDESGKQPVKRRKLSQSPTVQENQFIDICLLNFYKDSY